MPHIETERLLIRDLLTEDAELLARLWTDPEVTRYMGGPRAYEEVLQILEEDARAEDPPAFDLWPVIEKGTGQIVGHCGILSKEVDGREEHELVYVFHPSVWGRGYATEAASALRAYASETLGLSRIISLIDPDNAASERVAIKVGMRLEKEIERPGGAIRRVYVAKTI